MKKKTILTCTSALTIALGIANPIRAQEFDNIVSEFSVDAGYRQGTVKRDVGINMLDPTNNVPILGNIKHTTKFKLWDLQATSRTVIDNFYIRANVGYGKLFDSEEKFNADSLTYDGDPIASYAVGQLNNAAHERFGGVKKAKKHGHAFNVNAAIGYIIPLSSTVQIVPMVGFSHREMSFKKYLNDTSLGIVPSGVKQKERWSGPFIGLEMPIECKNGLKIVPLLEYHFAKFKSSYSGKNTGSDFRYYYSGSKRGHLIVAGIKGSIALNDQWSLEGCYSVQAARAKPAFKTKYVADTTEPGSVTTSKTKQGKVRYTEQSFQFGTTFSF